MGKKEKNLKYIHTRRGEFVKVEIRDETYNIVYRNKFEIKNKNAIISLLSILETYSGFAIRDLIREKLKEDWF